MIGIKKRLILNCFVAVLFVFSGCASLTRDSKVLQSNKTAVQKKDQAGSENKIKHSVSVKNVSGTEKTVAATAKALKAKPLRKAVKFPEKKISKEIAPARLSSNDRFEKAKDEMNASQSIAPAKKKNQSQGGISFNFDNADLYEVIRTMAEILNINYIVAPNIGGNVTIHTAGKLNKSDLFPLFFQILELNGLTALKEGYLYKIINAKNITATPILTRYGRDLNEASDSERIMMQIIPLKYISSEAMVKTLTPFVSESGTLIPNLDSEILIVIDKSKNLKRILQLIDIFDVDLFDNIKYRFFRLQNMETVEAGKLINALIGPYMKLGQSDSTIVSIENLNTIVAISNNERILDKIEMFIKKIDAQENVSDPRIFIYKVKNSEASDLASLLNQVFGKKDIISSDKRDDKIQTDSKKDAQPPPLFQTDNKKDIKKKSKTAIPVSPEIGGSASLSDEIAIIPDTIRNALIIEAVPSDYSIITKILKELDVMPRQVLIDVLILDVTLNDSTQFGVEWSFLKNRVGGDTGLLKANLGSAGLTFTSGLTDDWLSAVKALASDGMAEVLSAPSILASDNKPATINVVTQIPISTSTYDTENGVTTTSIQYRDTGIILTVTPHINDDGMVNMEISQEVSSQVDSAADETAPSFFNRSLATSLSVQDQQVIVIGGLISETKSNTSQGFPWLSKLPLIGFLFGEQKNSTVKSELIIMISPKVITTLSEIDLVSKEFTEKFSSFKDRKRMIDFISD